MSKQTSDTERVADPLQLLLGFVKSFENEYDVCLFDVLTMDMIEKIVFSDTIDTNLRASQLCHITV